MWKISAMNANQSTALKAKFVAPSEGKEVCAFGNTITFKLGQEDTGGALSLGFTLVPPGNGPPLHVHHSDDEIFIVTKGEFQYTAEGETRECGPGSVVYLPKGCVHSFKCISDY